MSTKAERAFRANRKILPIKINGKYVDASVKKDKRMSNTFKDNDDDITGEYTPVPSEDPAWLSQLWDRVQGGFSDVSVHDGSMVIDGFKLTAGLAALTGLQENPNQYLCLWSDERGFVSHMIMTEQELYQCEGMDVEIEHEFDYCEMVDAGMGDYDYEFGGEGG